MKKQKSKFYWDGKPIEEYSKEQIIDILCEIIQMIQVSISKEAVDYINRLIQKDKNDKQ